MSGKTLPDHLPGEPPPRTPGLPGALLGLLRAGTLLLFVALIGLPFWPLYLLLRLFYPRPPILPSPARLARALRLVLTERPIAPVQRLALLFDVLNHTAARGMLGFAWLLDELLYGRAMRAQPIVAPLFEISAARSGSTQLARYIAEDPAICAPSVLQEAFPFLWLWRLSPLLSRVMSGERFAAALDRRHPKEFIERHEASMLDNDTFEIAFQYAHHLGEQMISMSPGVIGEELRYGSTRPATRALWEEDFLRFIDALGRKALLFASRPDEPKTLFIKGHFLNVAPLLAKRYPDARFLTVLRAPDKRLQSVINFLRCQPTGTLQPAMPWSTAVSHALDVESEYCAVEQAWFTAAEGPVRVVVNFDDYVQDLEGTMRRVYLEYLGRTLPPHVPRTHAPRKRTHYSVDRSLEQLGVRPEEMQALFGVYSAWVRSTRRSGVA